MFDDYGFFLTGFVSWTPESVSSLNAQLGCHQSHYFGVCKFSLCTDACYKQGSMALSFKEKSDKIRLYYYYYSQWIIFYFCGAKNNSNTSGHKKYTSKIEAGADSFLAQIVDSHNSQ